MLSAEAVWQDMESLKSAMILGSESDCKKLFRKYQDILNSLQHRDYGSFAPGLPEDSLADLLIPEDVPKKLKAKSRRGTETACIIQRL